VRELWYRLFWDKTRKADCAFRRGMALGMLLATVLLSIASNFAT
jgi:hypothetical protein